MAERRKSTSTPARRAHIERVRPLAAAWHSTDEGRAWHAEHSARIWENRDTTTRTCERCGNQFEAVFEDRARYCSDNCSRAVREKKRAFDVPVPCPICGTEFWQNKWKKTPKTCCPSHGQQLRRQTAQTAERA
jgi:NADH pyrophosphatase NudC (nudix superfamily)